MKKKRFLFLGGMFLLLGVGLNVQYALNNYGILSNSLHIEILAQSNSGDWDTPWDSNVLKPGKIEDTRRCKLELGGGMFTSSIERVCVDQYVCLTCTCTPIACGDSSGW